MSDLYWGVLDRDSGITKGHMSKALAALDAVESAMSGCRVLLEGSDDHGQVVVSIAVSAKLRTPDSQRGEP